MQKKGEEKTFQLIQPKIYLFNLKYKCPIKNKHVKSAN